MSLLGFLDGAAPWWWLALGIALVLAEMLTVSFYLVWPGLSAMTLAALLWAFPGMSGELQLALFAGLAIAYTFAGRAWVRARGQPDSDRPALNRRSQQLVGRRATVRAVEPDGSVTVEIDGILWSAEVEGRAEAPAGTPVRITEARGTDLRVRVEAG